MRSGQGVDVAVGAVDHRHVAREPIGRHGAVAHEEAVERADEIGMARRRHLAVIGHLADLPQTLDGGLRAREGADVVLARDDLERGEVLRHGRAHEPVLARLLGEAVAQLRQGREIEVRIAPLQHAQGIERDGSRARRWSRRRRAGSARSCRRCRRACGGRRGRRSGRARPDTASGSGSRRTSCPTRRRRGRRRG